MTNNNVDIFSTAIPQDGEFFKFKNIGDSIQGTYIDVRNGVDSYGNQQTIYVLLENNSKVWNLGFRQTAMVIHDRMKGIGFGQIVGFRFDEERDSKKNPGTKAKIIRVYADPKCVDTEWLQYRKEVEKDYAQAGGDVKTQTDTDTEHREAIERGDIPFNPPVTGGSVPAKEEKPQNEAVIAIRNLAKTKGLTNDSMTLEEADATIEKYTGLTLEETNLTKVIIALTGYVSK